MSEWYNVWRGRSERVKCSSSPMIGMVYEGLDKFFGKVTRGVLVELYQENDEGVIRTRDDKLVSVDLLSLKVIVNE